MNKLTTAVLATMGMTSGLSKACPSDKIMKQKHRKIEPFNIPKFKHHNRRNKS